MNQLICDQDITLTVDGLPECASGWTQQPYVLPFDASQLTPHLVMTAFCGGFGLYLSVFVIGLGAKYVVKAFNLK